MSPWHGAKLPRGSMANANNIMNKTKQKNMKIHLSYTGFYAGTRLCGVSREVAPESTHAVYAPLHIPDYRAKCCDTCLDVYAEFAYDPEDEMPDWVKFRRH